MRSFSWLMCMALTDGSSVIGRARAPAAPVSGDDYRAPCACRLSASGRSSYADLSSVDHDATSGGKQRMTGGQDEPPMADGTQDREVAGVDDARPLDGVAERP